MENIEECLVEFINNPYNDTINFNLAVAYEKEKQYAAAFSYYLKCAEFTNNNILASECLIHCGLCINAQGGRDAKELYLIKHAITISPNSLEPYYIASLYFSWRSSHLPEQRFWLDSYMYANIAINLIENNIQSKEKFKIPIDYEVYELYYQKAYAGMNIGKINEAREIFIKILQNYELPDSTKNFIIFKLHELPEPNHPIIPYSKNNINKLKLLFNNSEKIDNNFSQIYQDMYVLSMHNGKMNGTYLEIGAGDYKYGNNTYLLESEFNWTGVSLDFNQNLVNNFNHNRNNNCICSDATTIDYLELLKNNYKSTNIDYLQLDCDPPNITFDILSKIPFDQYKFGVITYEHDFYNDITGSYREKAREFLKEKGYKLIAGNISPYGDKCPFEDWWIHPEVIDENIWKLFERDNDEPINGEKYMLTKSKYIQEPIFEISNKLTTNDHDYDKFINKNFISIGGWCGTKIAIKEFGIINEASLPFDNVRSSMEGIIDCFETDFKNYFPKEIIEDSRTLNDPHFIGEYIGFYHKNHNLLDNNVIESFKRKIVRFDKKIKKNNCIFIRTICREIYDDEIKQYKNLQLAIDKKYPNISYIICFIIPNQVNTQYYKHIDNRTFLFTLNDTSLVLCDGILKNAYKPIFDFIIDKNLFVNIPEPNVIEIIDAPSRLWLVQPEGHPMVNYIEKKTETIIDTKQVTFSHNYKIYSPKIIDCFIFNNELDLLNYRLNLLDDYVDYFVLVEATHTHTGKEKKLFYNENRDIFEKFKYKIIHIIVDDFPYKYPDIDIEKNQQWKNENYQRNCIKRGIDRLTLDDSDIITICDLDEIPNPKILNELKDNKRQITNSCLKMDMYYYNLNCKININDWISPKLISYNELNKLDITIHEFRYKKTDNIIENGGWHLSFFGDKDLIENKIKDYGHQEFNNKEILSNIEEKIKLNKDLFNRENHDIQYINIQDNDNLPPKYDIYLQKYFTLEIKENTNLIKDLYDYIPCHDQIGNDLYRVDISDIKNTLKTLAFTPEIQAVNTQGYIKNKVDKIEQINNWWYPNDGIYIKKPVNDYLKQVSQKSIPVFGTLVCTTSKWLIKQLESIDYPIENFIIINNNSKVLAKELDIIVKKEYKFIKNLKVYHMPYNLGCAEGWNMIIKSFMFSPYWIISNDDVSFGPGVLKNMNLAAQNSEVGLVHKNPALLPKMEKFGTFELFLIKDWVIQKYGLFDINFYPAYFEDYDYIMRLINKPIKIINSVDGIIYHGDTSNYNISGANTIKSNDKVKTRLLIAKYKNLEYFKKKWNCYPEYLSDNSRPNEYPFGNNNNLNNTYFDINFCREKHLLNTLDILDTPETSNTLNNNISLNIKEKLFVKQNLIVIDNFYDDPDKIRKYALSLNYQSPVNHGAVGYRCEYGRKIEDGTKQLFEKLLHTTIPNGNNHGEWNYSTNGCFQWCNAAVPIVYHCDSQKYAAIIYLTPDAPPNCGTSFFRHKKYKIRNSEIFSKSDWYQSDLNFKEPHLDKTQWEAVDNIGNVYNRLVIFDAQYIHAVTEYFGENINNSRLFQLFFFNVN